MNASFCLIDIIVSLKHISIGKIVMVVMMLAYSDCHKQDIQHRIKLTHDSQHAMRHE